MGLDGVELVLACESDFGIVIPDAHAAELRTPRMLADYISQALTADNRARPSGEVLLRILQLTSRQLSIPTDKIHPDHDFVKDLGLD